jgi:hypothetical protein
MSGNWYLIYGFESGRLTATFDRKPGISTDLYSVGRDSTTGITA